MGVVGVYNVPPIQHTFEDTEELTVTEYNTIMGKDFKEIPIDTFLNEIKKNVYISDMDFYYDDKNKQFIYKYRDNLNRLISYSFKLDNLTMANYELNKYNDTTLKIKQLVDLYNQKRKGLRIINHGNKGKPFNNEEDKLIYINYLQECNNQKILSIIKYIIKILLVSGGLTGYFIWSINQKEVLIAGCMGLFGVIPLSYTIYDILNIRKTFKEYKLNKHKIKKLSKSKILNNDSINIKQFDNTLENPIKEDLNNFTNYIMKEFSKLLNRINYLNTDNKNELLTQVQLLMDEYISIYKEILYNNSNNNLSLNNNDLENLKVYITKKISDIETEMNNIRNKDIKYEQILKEKAILDARIQDSLNNEERQVTATK